MSWKFSLFSINFNRFFIRFIWIFNDASLSLSLSPVLLTELVFIFFLKFYLIFSKSVFYFCNFFFSCIVISLILYVYLYYIIQMFSCISLIKMFLHVLFSVLFNPVSIFALTSSYFSLILFLLFFSSWSV